MHTPTPFEEAEKDRGLGLRTVRCRTFSATKARDRDQLGERATEFIRSSDYEIIAYNVVQSSDREFHCLSIVVWYR